MELLRNHGVPLEKSNLIGITVVHQTQVFRNSFTHIEDINKRLDYHWKRIAGLVDHIGDVTGSHLIFLP